MSQDTLSKDYKLLDLDDNATSQEARRAYHRMKALYAEGSLATYSLLTVEERDKILDNIERAYMRISREIDSHLPTPYLLSPPTMQHRQAPLNRTKVLEPT